jgi:hypothetical protein
MIIMAIQPLATLAFTSVLGLPLIAVLGMATLLSFLVTAGLPILRKRGVGVPFRWHTRMAYISIALALVHASFGLSVYL